MVWLVENTLYLLDAPEQDIFHLDIRGYSPKSVGFVRPELRVKRNLMRLSSNILLSDLRLSYTPDLALPHCLSTYSTSSSRLTIQDVDIECPIWIGENTFANIQRTTLPQLFYVSAYGGSLLLQNVIYNFTAPITMLFDQTHVQIVDSHFYATLHAYVFSTSFEITGSRFYGALFFDTNTTTTSLVQVHDSYMAQSFLLQGVRWTANFSSNVVDSYHQYLLSAIYGYPMKAVAQWDPVAVFSAVCDSSLSVQNNTFLNGTLYLDFPTIRSKNLYCPSTAYDAFRELTISHNRFYRAREVAYGVFGVSKTGMVPPSIAVNSRWSPFYINHADDLLTVSAHANWWGHSSGPRACYNPQGVGSIVSTFVDPSFWCLDPDCLFTSPIQISRESYTHGCQMCFSKSLVAVIGICSFVMFAITLSVIIYALIVNRIRFSPERTRYQESEELIISSSKLYYMGHTSSTVASVCVIVICALIVSSYNQTLPLPMQQDIYPASFQMLLVLLIVSALQIALNLYCSASMLLRRHLPRNLTFSLRLFAFCNALFVSTIALFSFSYMPSLYHSDLVASTDGPRSQGILAWYLFSNLNYYAFMPIFGAILSSLSCMIPARIVYNLICYPEYARMSSSLEEALISKIVKIPSVIRLSLGPLIVSSIGLLMGAAVFIIELTMYINPSVYYEKTALAQRALLPDAFVRIQFGIGLLFTFVGMAAQVASIWSTRRVRPVGIYTVISLFILVALVSIAGFINVYSQALMHKRSENTKWALANIVLEAFWFISLLLNFLLLRIIRRRIIQELPKYALEGINEHVDDIWYNSPTTKRDIASGESTKLIASSDLPTTTSEDEAPFLT